MRNLKRLFFICILVRISFVFIAKFISLNYLPLLGYLALIPSIGFLYQYQFSTQRGAFGGKLWWNDLRPIHSIFYFLFAINAINSKRESYEFMLIDVIIGAILSLGEPRFPSYPPRRG